MSIAAEGALRIEPFANVSPVDPLGSLIGVGQVTGDASAGNARVNWNLPNEFFYIMRGFSGFVSQTSAIVFTFEILTGVLLSGVAEQYKETVQGLAAPENAAALTRVCTRPCIGVVRRIVTGACARVVTTSLVRPHKKKAQIHVAMSSVTNVYMMNCWKMQ